MLESVYALNPRHPMVLDQLRQVHLARQDWSALCDLIPALHKVGKLTPKQEEDSAATGLVWSPATGCRQPRDPQGGMAGSRRANCASSQNCWPATAILLRQLGADGEAATLWQEALRKQPMPQLLARLPKLKLDSYQPLLTLLQKQQGQPEVDTALAQLYLLAGQLDDAQKLLEQEVERAPSAAAYHALGHLMDKRRLTNKANEYYRQALELAGI